MKKSLLISLLSFFVLASFSQNIWMNELHYDNVSTDEGEFIEVVLENAGTYNLADFTVTLYNGNGGASYDTKTLDQFTTGTVEGDFTILYYDYPSNGIQNGESDGVAISYQGTLIDGQFLSYEGTLTATDGPAAGFTSTDIGVSEIGAEVGTSLQLSGDGAQYDDFTWEESAPETKGALNNDQTFGTFIPDPEPTNYPTNFTADAIGINIALEWTDAVGEQLPSGYLILGQQIVTRSAAFTPPVDGVPVDNDLSWADGEIAANIPFGVETFTIEVDPNTQHNFIIYPYTNSGVHIDYKTDGTAPEASALSNNFEILNREVFAIDLGSWMRYSVTGDQEWIFEPGSGDPPGCAEMNGYDDDPVENEDWLISPNLGTTEVYEVFFSFFSAYGFTGPSLELFVSNDYDGSSNPNDFTWTSLTDLADWPDETWWEWFESGEIDITDYFGMDCYLAFKYTSSTEAAALWRVDNLLVYALSSVGLSENEMMKIQFYPNPATNSVQIKTESEGQFIIMNVAGQVVQNTILNAGLNRHDISELNTGVYFMQFIDNQKKTSTGKLVIK